MMDVPFVPTSQTLRLTVGPVSTVTPIQFAATRAHVYRVRNPSFSSSPVSLRFSAVSPVAATVPTAYDATGAGGVLGDKTIDPGTVEVYGLTYSQQDALTNGNLFLTAITPAGGSAVIDVTLGKAGV